MRVYKFLEKKWALAALRHKRLKIGRWAGLNDPFDLLPFASAEDDRDRRLALATTLAEMNARAGWICVPQRIYCDNGTEFVSAAMDLWAYTNTVILDFSRRGKPTDNAAIESFNGRFREECLNVHWFQSLEDAQQKIDAFRWDYNEHHPHRALKGLSPSEYARNAMTTAADSPS